MPERKITEFKILGGTHGRREPSGRILYNKLKKSPLPYVDEYITHPRLARSLRKKRYLGTRQIMAHYPGNSKGDPEDRAAFRTMKWLGQAVGDPDVVVFDVHNNMIPGLNYCMVGPLASKRALVAAYDLGYRRFMVSSGPFYKAVPNAAVLENSLADESKDAIAKRLYKGLQNLVAHEVDPQRFDAIRDNIKFYRSFELPSAGADGKLRPGLETLEKIPAQPAFTQLDLLEVDESVRVSFDLPPKIISGAWNHDNMSPRLLRKLGRTAGGITRREIFAHYFLELDPPKSQGEWVVFDSSNLRSKEIK
jgi:hypothetical protein